MVDKYYSAPSAEDVALSNFIIRFYDNIKYIPDEVVCAINIEDADVMIDKGFMSAPMLEVDGTALDFGKAVDWVKENA